MPNLLDHVPQTPLLEGIQDWPRSCSREEWFRITRELVQDTIAGLDLSPEIKAKVIEAFTIAGLF